MRVKTGITQKEVNIRMIAIELLRTFICFFLLFRANVSMSSRPHHHESRSQPSAQIPGISSTSALPVYDRRRIPGSQGSLGSMLGSLMYVSGTYRLYIGRASLPGSLLLYAVPAVSEKIWKIVMISRGARNLRMARNLRTRVCKKRNHRLH